MNEAIYTLLLVDDDPSILVLLRRFLQGAGYRILSTESPVDALALLGKESVDILISDIDMPVMDGLELVAKVRHLYPQVVRILLTGHGSLGSVLRAINEGEVYRYLLKPFDEASLLATVREATERLSELRRATMASQLASQRELLLTALEQEHPGIRSVQLTDGVYNLDIDRLRGVVMQLEPSLQAMFSPIWGK